MVIPVDIDVNLLAALGKNFSGKNLLPAQSAAAAFGGTALCWPILCASKKVCFFVVSFVLTAFQCIAYGQSHTGAGFNPLFLPFNKLFPIARRAPAGGLICLVLGNANGGAGLRGKPSFALVSLLLAHYSMHSWPWLRWAPSR